MFISEILLNVACGLNIQRQSCLICGVYCSFFFPPNGHLIISVYKGRMAVSTPTRLSVHLTNGFPLTHFFKGCSIQLVYSPPADGTVLHDTFLFKMYLS